MIPSESIRVGLASATDRETIYRLRHRVYAAELGQHPETRDGRLRDSIDDHNQYIVAYRGEQLGGFISITPPGRRFSLEKHHPLAELPFRVDERSFEVRLLTVRSQHRGSGIAAVLVYAAFRWVESFGGTSIIGMGRRDLMAFYSRFGLEGTGIPVRSGRVDFEVMSANVAKVREQLDRSPFAARLLQRWESRVEWNLPARFRQPARCFHGGAFFEAIGEEFDDLARRRQIINADVLDAWFPPSPGVRKALATDLAWIVRTSPPTDCGGLTRAIARARGVPQTSVLPAAGSSDLIFLCFPRWLRRESRALVLDPTYGEYLHVLEKVVGCRVDRFALERSRGYQVDSAALGDAVARGAYDLVVLVNPNSPTGRVCRLAELRSVIARAPLRTRFWIDETYLEYCGETSLERDAAGALNVVVCKSLSKAYALSGLRVGYLVGAPPLVEDLREVSPPWAVSLPAQIAAVKAFRDAEYYRRRHRQTGRLRGELQTLLERIPGIEVVPGVANFLFAHLPEDGPSAAAVVAQARQEGLFLRDASPMGRDLGLRAIRIAVKSKRTNHTMVAILHGVLDRLGRQSGETPDFAAG